MDYLTKTDLKISQFCVIYFLLAIKLHFMINYFLWKDFLKLFEEAILHMRSPWNYPFKTGKNIE